MEAEKPLAEDKGRLADELLRNCGSSFVLGNNHSRESVIMQINMMGRDELSEILHVIAERIVNEGK